MTGLAVSALVAVYWLLDHMFRTCCLGALCCLGDRWPLTAWYISNPDLRHLYHTHLDSNSRINMVKCCLGLSPHNVYESGAVFWLDLQLIVSLFFAQC